MIPLLDLSVAQDESGKRQLLADLHNALFNVGFLYVKNHGVDHTTIQNLTDRLPGLFDLPAESKQRLTKLNSPHFLGYNGFAEETTAGKQDLREQFDFATELPLVWKIDDVDGVSETGSKKAPGGRDFSKLYWRLRGPNQWPNEDELPGFRKALIEYGFR
jgi:isopenicillin N synthase-like dioxygenase